MLVQCSWKRVADAGAAIAMRFRVVAKQPAVRGICFVREREGPSVMLAFFPRGRESKQQRAPYRTVHTRGTGELLELMQGVVVLRKAPRCDQCSVTPCRVDGFDPLEQCDRLLDAAELHEKLTQSFQRREHVRPLIEHLPITPLSCAIARLLRIDVCECHLDLQAPLSLLVGASETPFIKSGELVSSALGGLPGEHGI